MVHLSSAIVVSASCVQEAAVMLQGTHVSRIKCQGCFELWARQVCAHRIALVFAACLSKHYTHATDDMTSSTCEIVDCALSIFDNCVFSASCHPSNAFVNTIDREQPFHEQRRSRQSCDTRHPDQSDSRPYILLLCKNVP